MRELIFWIVLNEKWKNERLRKGWRILSELDLEHLSTVSKSLYGLCVTCVVLVK